MCTMYAFWYDCASSSCRRLLYPSVATPGSVDGLEYCTTNQTTKTVLFGVYLTYDQSFRPLRKSSWKENAVCVLWILFLLAHLASLGCNPSRREEHCWSTIGYVSIWIINKNTRVYTLNGNKDRRFHKYVVWFRIIANETTTFQIRRSITVRVRRYHSKRGY